MFQTDVEVFVMFFPKWLYWSKRAVSNAKNVSALYTNAQEVRALYMNAQDVSALYMNAQNVSALYTNALRHMQSGRNALYVVFLRFEMSYTQFLQLNREAINRGIYKNTVTINSSVVITHV